MSNEWRGYDFWKTSGPPDEDYDEDAVLERIKEDVEDENPDWTEEQVEKEVRCRFDEEE